MTFMEWERGGGSGTHTTIMEGLERVGWYTSGEIRV